MDIKFFIYSLLGLSILAYFIPIKNIEKNQNIEDIPQVIFEKPKMYTITEKQISRLVNSSYAMKYKTRDEMINADITLRNKDKKKNFLFEKLKADLIVKKGTSYKLINNVEYSRDYFITLNTSEFFYDTIKKIGYNTKNYEGTYYKNLIKGNSVYIDLNKNFLKSKSTHLELNIKKGKK